MLTQDSHCVQNCRMTQGFDHSNAFQRSMRPHIREFANPQAVPVILLSLSEF